MPQENFNKIYNAGKFFEPEPEQNPKPNLAEIKPSNVKRKISVAGAFMEKQEDPFKKKVEEVLKGMEGIESAGVAKEEEATSTENLESNGTCTVGPLDEEFNPKEFFNDKNKSAKLFIGNSFKNKVAGSARNISEQPSTAISSFTLKKPVLDSEILAELPNNHIFSEDDLWMIADLLKKQPNGEIGELLADGKANFFYVQAGASIPVVRVRWGGSGWDVDGWCLVGLGRWHGGCRVFSRNG